MTELGSAPLPPLGPDDHVRGPDDGPLVIEYADFECPFCAVVSLRLEALPLRRAFRHFPVKSSHPRAWAAACAAEAASGIHTLGPPMRWGADQPEFSNDAVYR
jgi:protein-disulfide isomerase